MLQSQAATLVFGARGKVGSAVLAGLKMRSPERTIVAGISGPHGRLPDIEFCETPLDDASRLSKALSGVDRVFLMIPFGTNMTERLQTFTQCARARGVDFVVRLSGLDARVGSPSAMGRLQGALDLQLLNSGIDCCILRCNSFMQNFSGIYRPMLQKGRLALAQGAGQISFIDCRDIGRAAATILANPDDYRGRVLDLNGPEPLSNNDAVAHINRVTGGAVRYEAITEEKARQGYRRAGLPGWEIDVFLSLDRYLREGGGARSSTPLFTLLGKAPTTFAEFALDYKTLWMPLADA